MSADPDFPCPYCGRGLATHKAQQCLSCGMDWHDPDNVVQQGDPERNVAGRVERMIAGYDRGIYTQLEAGSQIMQCITPQNVADVFSDLPAEFAQQLKLAVESAPMTDDEWDAAIFFHIGSVLYAHGYEPPLKSDAQQLTEMQESKRRHRARVEAIREYLAAQQFRI